MKHSSGLRAWQDATAIIVATHCYMRPNKRDTDCATSYKIPGNSGEQIWEKSVRKQPNVFLVVSGHVLGVGRCFRARVTTTKPSATRSQFGVRLPPETRLGRPHVAPTHVTENDGRHQLRGELSERRSVTQRPRYFIKPDENAAQGDPTLRERGGRCDQDCV
jgi:hypothetical protein